MAKEKLTAKQRKFVEVYAGNGVEAARLAGYTGNDKTLRTIASENMAKPDIAQAIKKREERELRPAIASRKQRQEFWTSVMNDLGEEMPFRLKASELLGRSEADFTERLEHTGSLELAAKIAEARKRISSGDES